ncbi:MAG TPA: dUTP diphosphatase [Clostridiaceae bacterium]|nr:dUTP diphosphatase [Clostridiaceae bacterium]
MVDVYVEIIREGVKLPSYANPYDAGMDVCAAEDTVIKPGETVIIPTGLKFAIPEGYEIQVRPRSGISLKTPLRLANSPGTIDAGYRDELGIIVSNTSPEGSSSADNEKMLTLDCKGNQKGTYIVRKGERVAQLVLAQVPRMNLKVVESVKNIGTDRGGGFGSTGL